MRIKFGYAKLTIPIGIVEFSTKFRIALPTGIAEKFTTKLKIFFKQKMNAKIARCRGVQVICLHSLSVLVTWASNEL